MQPVSEIKLQLVRPHTGNIQFIHDLLLDGAQHGHFSPKLLEVPGIIDKTLTSLLKTGRLYSKPLRAAPIIFMHSGKKIGFAIMAELDVDQGGTELYAMAVAKPFRGKGYGRAILKEILQRWSDVELYARCYPASEQMYQMLLKYGFVHLYDRPDGSRVLCRTNSAEVAVSA